MEQDKLASMDMRLHDPTNLECVVKEERGYVL